MQDTYMVGNNVTFSTQWDTPCTLDYGDCGYVATNFMQSSAVYSIRVTSRPDATTAKEIFRTYQPEWMNLESVYSSMAGNAQRLSGRYLKGLATTREFYSCYDALTLIHDPRLIGIGRCDHSSCGFSQTNTNMNDIRDTPPVQNLSLRAS